MKLDQLPIKELSIEDKKFLEKFENLIILSMNNTGLISLKNFPNLSKLEKLYLNNNLISGGLENLWIYRNLRTIELTYNQISEFEAIKPITKLECIECLAFKGNPFVDSNNYDKYISSVFKMIPNLCILDHQDVDGNHAEDDMSDVSMDPGCIPPSIDSDEIKDNEYPQNINLMMKDSEEEVAKKQNILDYIEKGVKDDKVHESPKKESNILKFTKMTMKKMEASSDNPQIIETKKKSISNIKLGSLHKVVKDKQKWRKSSLKYVMPKSIKNPLKSSNQIKKENSEDNLKSFDYQFPKTNKKNNKRKKQK